MKHNTRRNLLALGLTSLWLPAYSQAPNILRTPERPAQSHPQLPFRRVNVPEDKALVIMFFDFACPFCARYHEPIVNWARTVPSKIRVRFVPVVNVHDTSRRELQALSALAFYAAHRLGTADQLKAFVANVYESFANQEPIVGTRIWDRAIRASRMNRPEFYKAFQREDVAQNARFAGVKTLQYALTATPSLAVGGKYVLIPDDVGGDQEMFFNILNGLTSEAINAL